MRLTKIVAISSAFALVTALGMQGASALVWTDLADYSPGSVVTIHGDNSDGAAYVDGESVAVSVLGPNGYTAECTATVASGIWACDITLWSDDRAVGPYTYAATGATSGVVETGEFTDGDTVPVSLAVTQTGLTSGSFSLPILVTYKPGAPAQDTVTSTEAITTSGTTVTLNVKKQNVITYSGFVDTVTVGGQVCTRAAATTASGSVNVGSGSSVIPISRAYTCVAAGPSPAAPVVTYALSSSPNANGWYNSDVHIDWTVTGVPTPSTSGCEDETVSEEGTAVTRTCIATNASGSDSKTVTLKIDKTAPTATLAADRDPNANGWYNADVVVVTDGTDSLSGIDATTCPETRTVSVEGTTTLNGSCTDLAGNTGNATALVVKLDKTAPTAVLTPTGTGGANGWFIDTVTITTTGEDGLSDIDFCTAPQSQTVETTSAVFNGSCTDKAGNVGHADAITVKLDRTGPSATLAVTAGTAGSNGWYTSDVTVGTTGSDSISSPVTCTADQFQTTETTGTTFNGSCTNDAGLTTNATALIVKLDKTAPGVQWNGGPASGGVYYYNYVPLAPTCTALDALSGAGTCDVTGHSTAIGNHTMSATAYDLAGNQTIDTRSYSVETWTLRGFYQPVDMGSVWNVVKAGATVPLKFEVFAGTTELTTKDAIVTGPGAGFTFVANPAGGPPPVATDVIPTDALGSGKTQLRYDTTSGQFIQNWQTPKAPGYYKVTLKTLDGSTLVAWFLLK